MNLKLKPMTGSELVAMYHDLEALRPRRTFVQRVRAWFA